MAYTYDDLHKMTVAELRDIAKGIEHEAVQGYTQMNKDHLLPAVCQALGVEVQKHPHHTAAGIAKAKVKEEMKKVKAEKDQAREAHDTARLKQLRRRYHRLNRRIRGASA